MSAFELCEHCRGRGAANLRSTPCEAATARCGRPCAVGGLAAADTAWRGAASGEGVAILCGKPCARTRACAQARIAMQLALQLRAAHRNALPPLRCRRRRAPTTSLQLHYHADSAGSQWPRAASCRHNAAAAAADHARLHCARRRAPGRLPDAAAAAAAERCGARGPLGSGWDTTIVGMKTKPGDQVLEAMFMRQLRLCSQMKDDVHDYESSLGRRRAKPDPELHSSAKRQIERLRLQVHRDEK